MSRAELIHEIQRTQEDVNRWEQQHKQLTEAISHRSKDAPLSDGESATAILQVRR